MGRDAYLFYFPELNPLRGEHMLLESALWQALRRGELRLYYQPVVTLATGRVASVEAQDAGPLAGLRRGHEALHRIQNTFARLESNWRPASMTGASSARAA